MWGAVVGGGGREGSGGDSVGDEGAHNDYANADHRIQDAVDAAVGFALVFVDATEAGFDLTLPFLQGSDDAWNLAEIVGRVLLLGRHGRILPRCPIPGPGAGSLRLG